MRRMGFLVVVGNHGGRFSKINVSLITLGGDRERALLRGYFH